MPLLSIIIPSYNSLKVLRESINSIQNQSFTDYEVLVIDANSSDGTKGYLKSLIPPIFFVSESDQGIYDAMNKGIALSKGDWIYFMGCDDQLFESRTLQTVFEQEIDRDISLIIGKVQYEYSDSDSYWIKRNKGLFEPSWSSKIWLKNTIHHQGIFYKKEVFLTQTYSLDYKVLSDYDLNLKLYRSNLKVKMLDQIIAISRTEGVSKNYDWQLYNEEINLKSNQGSLIFRPLFYMLGLGKYMLKKIL